MTDFEPEPGFGGSFQLEVAQLQNFTDSLLLDDKTRMSEVHDLIKEFEADNPYVGREVILYTSEPVVVFDEDGKGVKTLPAGQLACKIDGFFTHCDIKEWRETFFIEPLLGVQVRFDADQFGTIATESIESIRLKNETNPFGPDMDNFSDAVEKFEEAELIDITLDSETFCDEFVRRVINRTSVVVGNVVEVLFCEPTFVEFITEPLLPAWLEDRADEDDVDDDELPVPAKLEEMTVEEGDIEYRGPLKGRVHSYEVWDNDGDPCLAAIIELPVGHPWRQDYNALYAAVWTDDVSTGKIISGPIAN